MKSTLKMGVGGGIDEAGLEKLQETTVFTVTPRSSLTRILLYTDPSSSTNHTPRGILEPTLYHHPVKSVQISWVIFQLVTRTESLASVWRMEEGLKKRTLLRPSQRPGLLQNRRSSKLLPRESRSKAVSGRRVWPSRWQMC